MKTLPILRTALILAAFTAATAHAEDAYVPTYDDLKAQAAAVKETVTKAPELTASMLTHLDNLRNHTKGVESCIALKGESSQLMDIVTNGGNGLEFLTADYKSLKLKLTPEQDAELHTLVGPEANKLLEASLAGIRAETEAPQCL